MDFARSPCKFDNSTFEQTDDADDIVGMFAIANDTKNPMSYSTETFINELTPVFQVIIQHTQSCNSCLETRVLQINVTTDQITE